MLAGTVGLLLVSIALVFWDSTLFSSVLVSFSEFYLLTAGVLLLFPVKGKLFCIQKSTALLIFIFNSYLIWPSVFLAKNTNEIVPEQTQSKKIYYANVNSRNDSKDFIWNQIRHHQADIIMLVEFNREWAESFTDLQKDYPYSKMIFHRGNFGLGIFSKYELKNEYVIFERVNHIPALFVDVELESGLLNLVLLHAFPPIGNEARLLRDQYLSTVAHKVRARNFNTLICGDFNAVPWSQEFKKFIEISNTTPIAHSLFSGTWPTFGYPFNIKIDHCLSSTNIILSEHKILKDSSSDHHPLLFKLNY